MDAEAGRLLCAMEVHATNSAEVDFRPAMGSSTEDATNIVLGDLHLRAIRQLDRVRAPLP